MPRKINNGQDTQLLRKSFSAVVGLRLLNPGFLLLSGLLLVLLVTGIAVVHSTHKSRYALHELQQLRAERNALEVQWGQLLIEQSTFGLESRIERRAMEELNMHVPDWSDIVVVRYE